MKALSLEHARSLDAADPLRILRQRFRLAEDICYLDGNSLGALPIETIGRIANLIALEWGRDLIRSWHLHDWIGAPLRVGDKIARVIGAGPGETIACDSTSVNLCKLIHAAVAAKPDRSVILSERGNFPTDVYIAEGVVRSLGGQSSLKLVPSQELIASIDADTALVLLTHIHYQTAAKHDMRAITEAAHKKGALVLWDLSHSAGATKVDLNGVGADLAVGCGYKYLNGGPGAPAFLFVAQRHHKTLRTPMSGWMGHARAFDFLDQYEPAEGIRQFLCGTPDIIGLAALEIGVDLVIEAGIDRLAAKSIALGEYFIRLLEERCAGYALRLAVPRDHSTRGSHVALAHPHGYSIMQALIAHGVIGDFRAPDVVRFGLTPLYTRFEDIWRAIDTLRAIMENGCWNEKQYSVRGAVS